MEPLEQFICDTCDTIIEKVENGAIEYLSSYDKDGKQLPLKSFRICHAKSQCYKHLNTSGKCSRMLSEFNEENKVILLLELIDREYVSYDLESLKEFLELFRRLTIPYYEEARQYWASAKKDGLIINKITCYQESSLKKIIKECR
jgi:hypothetical protein